MEAWECYKKGGRVMKNDYRGIDSPQKGNSKVFVG